jgi:PleD family two-component response regulator
VLLATGAGPAEALAGADMACYAAKRAGRNRVHWGQVPQSASAQ